MPPRVTRAGDGTGFEGLILSFSHIQPVMTNWVALDFPPELEVMKDTESVVVRPIDGYLIALHISVG